MDSDSNPPEVNRGIQSGQKTQYLYSEGDIRESDGDALTARATVGKFVIPRSIKFL